MASSCMLQGHCNAKSIKTDYIYMYIVWKKLGPPLQIRLLDV